MHTFTVKFRTFSGGIPPTIISSTDYSAISNIPSDNPHSETTGFTLYSFLSFDGLSLTVLPMAIDAHHVSCHVTCE